MRRSVSRPVVFVALPFALLLVGLFAVAAAQPAEKSEASSSCPSDSPPLCGDPSSPASYGIQDFPCTAAEIESWVSGRCGHRQREHAWYLFAGLTAPQSDGRMLWQTWPTSTQTFAQPLYASEDGDTATEAEPAPTQTTRSSLAALPGGILERPTPETPRLTGAEDATTPGLEDKDLATAGAPTYTIPPEVAKTHAQCVDGSQLVDGPTFQNEGNVMIAGVIFSPDADEFIRRQRYWDAEVLEGLLAESDKAIEQLPQGSFVLKPMLWPVPGDGYVPLPLWDDLSPTADVDPATGCERYAGFERQELWRTAVALTAGPDAEPGTRRSVTYLVDGNASRVTSLYSASAGTLACAPKTTSSAALTYESAKVVALDRFYTIRFTLEELEELAPCDRALLDQSAYWSYGRRFEAGDALALVAMHIMSKEQPGWTFQSVWWNDLPDTCWQADGGNEGCPRYASSRPKETDNGPPTWRNYEVTTTYGMTQKSSQQNHYPPNVKSKTSWPVAYNPYIELAAAHPIETNCMNCHHRAAWPSRLSDRTPSGAYLVEGPGFPNVIEEFTTDNPIFEGLLRTDALWAISDRAIVPSKPLPPGRGSDGEAGDAPSAPGSE